MKCIKCGSKNQQGNFCSNCGTKLREKCPECGQMELIGRLVCETKLQKANKLRWNYVVKKTRQVWRVLLYASFILLIAILGIISIVLLTESTLEIILLCFFIIVFTLVKITKFQERIEKRAEKKFFELNPEYAKIIEKAKGGKNNE